MKWILSIIISLFLSLSAYCEILPDGSEYDLYDDFSGGLNTNDPPHKLQKTESPYIRNNLIDNGEIEPPAGTYILGSTSTFQKINLFKRYVKDDGTVEFIVSDSSVVLKTQDFSQYTLLKSGLNGSYRLRAKQVESKMYFTNSSDSPWTYNGTTVVVLDGGTYNIGKTPNMPKFKYLEYFQNRLWGFNLPDNPSALRWSLFQSTDTVPIAYAPDHELAWSNSNLQINIDKGNGTVGTFLRVYAGQLFAGKERGIHYIYGNDDTNYNPVPIVKDYGFLSDESVVEQDNVLLGYGNDGFYEFNGQQMTRISDKIFPDILAINSGVNKNVTITWDTQAQFLRGSFSGAIATSDGLISIATTSQINFANQIDTRTYSAYSELVLPVGALNTSSSTAFGVYIATIGYGVNSLAYVETILIPACFTNDSGLGGIDQFRIDVRNSRTGQISSHLSPPLGTCPLNPNMVTLGAGVFEPPVLFSDTDLTGGNLTFKFSAEGTKDGNYVHILSATTPFVADINLKNSTTFQYISDVATVTTISNWSNFNALVNNNSGNINFFYHTSTSASMVSTQPWISIVPGGLIGSSITNTYIQWASTISSPLGSTNIDNVKIVYQQGGASDVNPFGQSWRNSYYLFVTTTTDGLTTLCYVKSRIGTKNPYGWTVLEGINIKSSLATPDVWYLGSSTAGVAMRGDYGTNYNGNPIVQIYETNENNFQYPFVNKNITEFGLDTDYFSSSTYTIFTSIDAGDYVSQDVNNSGTGRMIRRFSYPFQKGNNFRFRFLNSQLDKPMRIYNWIVYFKKNATRTNTP